MLIPSPMPITARKEQSTHTGSVGVMVDSSTRATPTIEVPAIGSHL